jgi:DNA-binding SARP family transcriptional activator/class 3 adenylate cyclase
MAETVLATVLFTDIVGSTDHAARLGDARWGAVLEEHHRLVREELGRFGGRELDTAGDGFFASFEAPGRAVRCAAAIVGAVRDIGISVRAGVHTGECETVGDKLGGLAVHLGSRISAEAGPGDVLVSSTVRDLLAGSGITFEDRGLHALKGIPGEWRLYAVDTRTLEAPAHPARVQLCGRMVVELDGRRVEELLPGRQGKVLFAYLATNRLRPIGRDDLIEALWADAAPAGADTSLSALLSKLRRALGGERLEGRSTLQLQLPEGTVIDLEAASEALHRADSAVAQEDWGGAWAAARVPLHVAARPFLPGEDAPWIEDVRRQLDEMYVRALEITAEASLALGGTEIDTAERSARSLVRVSPYRDSGYRYLMRALDARGNRAEALRVYEDLRTLLREELGAAPANATQDLHRSLLGVS